MNDQNCIKFYIFSTSSLSSSCLPLVLLLVLTCCFLLCLKELLRLVLDFRFMLLRLLPCSRLKFLRWWRTVVRVLDFGLLPLVGFLGRYLPVLGSLFAFNIDIPNCLDLLLLVILDIFLAMLDLCVYSTDDKMLLRIEIFI